MEEVEGGANVGYFIDVSRRKEEMSIGVALVRSGIISCKGSLLNDARTATHSYHSVEVQLVPSTRPSLSQPPSYPLNKPE